MLSLPSRRNMLNAQQARTANSWVSTKQCQLLLKQQWDSLQLQTTAHCISFEQRAKAFIRKLLLTECSLCQAAVYRMGCKVHSETGCKDDPQYGWYMLLPNSKHIVLIFVNNVWQLPMWTVRKTRTVLAAQAPHHIVPVTNP